MVHLRLSEEPQKVPQVSFHSNSQYWTLCTCNVVLLIIYYIGITYVLTEIIVLHQLLGWSNFWDKHFCFLLTHDYFLTLLFVNTVAKIIKISRIMRTNNIDSIFLMFPRLGNAYPIVYFAFHVIITYLYTVCNYLGLFVWLWFFAHVIIAEEICIGQGEVRFNTLWKAWVPKCLFYNIYMILLTLWYYLYEDHCLLDNVIRIYCIRRESLM